MTAALVSPIEVPALDSIESEAEQLRVEFGLTRTISRVLSMRGINESSVVREFLEPRLTQLTLPNGMLDREIATDRLAVAVRNRERVVVFGDYDVDGITSTAIMTYTLSMMGAEVIPLLASRFDGGYGFSETALSSVKALAPKLVITCDCGSSDHERLKQLRPWGIDAIVIDHHLVPEEELPVHAFLNPHRPQCKFPFKHLASCGLALSLCAALRTQLGVAFDVRELLDLVALGTIADVASLTGDNRILVRAGLSRMARTPRPGLAALSEFAKISPNVPIRGEDIAYRFAPRINAPGRLGRPDVALELLLAPDLARARPLAARLEHECQTRREIERRIAIEAFAQVEATRQTESPAIVVASSDWHVGVVGIVAARLVERYQVPVVVIAIEDGATGRGSARGPAGARLHDALSRTRDTLIGFGGHQAAAGVHVSVATLERFRESFTEACAHIEREKNLDHVASQPSIHARSVAIDPLDNPYDIVHDLDRMEPCGEGNKAPILSMEGVVTSKRIIKKDHLRLVVLSNGHAVDAFGYNLAHQAPASGTQVQIFGSLQRDHYNGGRQLEFRLSAVHSISTAPSRRRSF